MRKSSSPPLILLSKKSKAPLMHDFEDQFNSRIENIHNSFGKQLHYEGAVLSQIEELIFK